MVVKPVLMDISSLNKMIPKSAKYVQSVIQVSIESYDVFHKKTVVWTIPDQTDCVCYFNH